MTLRLCPRVTPEPMETGRVGYRDIAERLRSDILSGSLHPGTRLPSVRALAREAAVALTTAQRAYAELRRLGLIEMRHGSGTHVAGILRRDAGTAVLSLLPASGPIMSFERLSEGIGLRSLATGVPDPELFLFEDLLAEFEQLRRGSPWNWYYSPACGHAALRTRIVTLLSSREIVASEGEILITNGSTDALSLVLAELAPPGATVILEQPAFMGANEMLAALRLRVALVTTSTDGIDLDEFERAAIENARAVAILFPTFHPATGRSTVGRAKLLSIARKRGVSIIEVDRYRSVAFEPPPEPLAARDSQVVYIDSFSYSLAPGLRLGYIRAEKTLVDRLIQRSLATGLCCSTPMQVALAGFMGNGGLGAHLQRTVPEYRRRRDALLRSLRLRMPAGVTWTEPGGGFALWVELPPGDYDDLYAAALAQGVAFTPSHLLLVEPNPRRLRLAFGCQEPAAIDAAIETLARLVRARAYEV